MNGLTNLNLNEWVSSQVAVLKYSTYLHFAHSCYVRIKRENRLRDCLFGQVKKGR